MWFCTLYNHAWILSPGFQLFIFLFCFYSSTKNSFKDPHLTQFTFQSIICKLPSVNISYEKCKKQKGDVSNILSSKKWKHVLTLRLARLHWCNTGAMIYRICLFCQALHFRHLYPLQPIPPATASQFRHLGHLEALAC